MAAHELFPDAVAGAQSPMSGRKARPGDREAPHPRDNDEDGTLFRRLMADAKRLETDTAPPEKPRASPRARFARRDRQAILRESPTGEAGDGVDGDHPGGEVLRYQGPSVGRAAMRRLARGGYGIRAEIDLHGLTRREAQAELQAFLADCLSRGYECVRIVHGKGRGSGQGGPVLKRNVDRWLRGREAVLAFVTARPVDGGSGAVYVLLRNDR